VTVQQVASSFHDELQTAAAGTAARVAGLWRQVDPSAIIDSWAELLPEAVADVAVGQAAAATTGSTYTASIVREQGLDFPVREANPRALSGVASDGRPLETLFALPAHQTVGRIGRGQGTQEAMESTRRHLMMFAATQAQDAGRQSASVGMVGTRQLGGYRRQLTPPSCARCAILAGKWFRWNQGFQRHPSCDCVHVPSVGESADVGGLETFDPQAHFNSLPAAEQDRVFTQAGAQAIRDGANMNLVVNARRGLRTTAAYGRKISTTLEGTTSRAMSARIMNQELDVQFGRRRQGDRSRRINVPRLTPEQIYADASSREDAIRLLGRFGYLGGWAPRIRPTRA